MFEDYYNAELAFYRFLAQEFAQEYPEVDHMVSERRGDNSVERLMQGASLLTARMRARLDDDFPEVIHTLFDAMWPQYLRPRPAVTLLQFTPRPNVLRQSQPIPRGTETVSREVEGVECPFRTSSLVALHPVELESVELGRPHPADLQLSLRFRMTGGVMFDTVKLRSLRLHLLGERSTRFTLYLWLTHHLQRITVRDGEGKPCLTLNAGCVCSVGFGDAEHLCDHLPTPLPGVRLVQEYFAFVDKFLGVDIKGLGGMPPGRIKDSFHVVFHLGTPPAANLKVAAENFALGCAPAVNLSPPEQVDVPVHPGVSEFRLRAPSEGEIYTVDRVGAYDSRSGQWINYPSLFSQREDRAEQENPRYQVLRRSDGVEGVEVYLAIRDPEGRPLPPPAEMLHVDLTYTNGNRPMRLGEGKIDVPTSSSPEFCLFRNVGGVVAPAPLQVDRDRHWELLALFSMHPLDLMAKDGLAQLLQACLDLKSNSSQMMPDIRDVRVVSGTRLRQRTVVPVTHAHVDLGREAFSSEGELFLFARVLAHLLMDRPASTVVTEVTVRGVPDGSEYHFRDL